MPRRTLALAYAAAQRAAARSDLDLLVTVTAEGDRVIVVPREAAEVIGAAVLDALPTELVAEHADVLAANAVRALAEDAREALTLRGRVARAADALRGER